MEMTYDAFLDGICHRTGIDSAREAEALAKATLSVLGEVLLESDRDALAGQLPAALAEALRSRRAGREYDLEHFYERLSREAPIRGNGGRARECAQVVGRTLTRAVDAQLTTRLRRRLPEEFEELFVNPHRAAGSEPTLDPRARANERTLARGRPGSDTPVSESRPPTGQTDSIAAQDNPYGDTKLATGHPSSEEDEETLTGGRPGSDRPVSDTHES
jgi:uncharacterized protein (DUF2267 family)